MRIGEERPDVRIKAGRQVEVGGKSSRVDITGVHASVSDGMAKRTLGRRIASSSVE